MIKIELNPKKLYEACILSSLTHAVAVGMYPELNYEHSWDKINYSMNDSEGCRATITFHKNHIISVFQDNSCVDTDVDALDFFEGAPKIQKLIIRSIPEDTSRLAALETGEIDIATGLAPINAQTVEANDKLELISEPTTATEYICLNVEKAPFTNKEFRQALNYAIDKKSIVDSIFSGKGKVAKSIVNPNVFGYYDGLEEYPFNPEKAKELIEKSGVKDKSFSLYVNDSPVRLQVAQIIQANLKDVGIDMKIETLEWGTYLQKTGEGDFTAYLGGWISGTSDADIVLYPLLDSKSIGFPGNRARYSNPEFDKEVELARIALKPEERKEHYKNAQIIAREDSPLIVLFNKNENIGINKRILGFEYDPTTMHKFKNLDVK